MEDLKKRVLRVIAHCNKPKVTCARYEALQECGLPRMLFVASENVSKFKAS